MSAGEGVLCGNCVYVDRIYMEKDFPNVIPMFHFRQIDVSSFREFGLLNNNSLMMSAPKKIASHRALDDIKESIDELRWYSKRYLKTDNFYYC